MEVLSEDSMLSPYGIRSLSRRHLDAPFTVTVGGQEFRVDYEPAESGTAMYGGNSNWRGLSGSPSTISSSGTLSATTSISATISSSNARPVPGVLMNLKEVADEIRNRLIRLFVADENGRRPVLWGHRKFNEKGDWSDLVMFHEYFNGDNGVESVRIIKPGGQDWLLT